MQNPYKDAATELRFRANNGHLSGSIPGMAAVQAAITLLEEAGQKLQRYGLQAEIEAFDVNAAVADDERAAFYDENCR